MKNRGYTLLEVLGVIIILALLTTLVFPTIINSIKKSSDTTDNLSMELINNAADLYIENHSNDFVKYNGSKYIIEIQDLIDSGNLPNSIKLSNVDNLNDKCLQVIYDNDIFSYELKVKGTCENYLKVCKLISGNKNTNGSKYECEVKPGTKYNFFVISQESDGTTNLIMERNICEDGTVATAQNTCLVAWNNESGQSQNEFGPVTAMDYLYNATDDWINIPNIKMNYTDEGNTGSYGYGTIKTTNNITKVTKKDGSAVTVLTDKEGYTNLKARLPRYNEVTGTGRCTIDGGSCPLYLVNYLENSGPVTGEGLQNISGIYGYWTLSSYANRSNSAWRVTFYGDVDSDGDVNGHNVGTGSSDGVRPVINLKL